LKLLEFATVGCCRRDNDGALVPYAQNPNLDNDVAQRSGGTTAELLQSWLVHWVLSLSGRFAKDANPSYICMIGLWTKRRTKLTKRA